jgi:hypothetical protein
MKLWITALVMLIAVAGISSNGQAPHRRCAATAGAADDTIDHDYLFNIVS